MEPKTLELLRMLQAGAHDAQTFDSIRSLLATQRSRLAGADDRATLADLSELLEVWAEGAPPSMAATALIEAAQIAEQHLEQSERAVQLYLDSIERDPGDLSALHKVEELLSRQEKDSDRLEHVLSEQAAALRIRDDFEPLLTAEVYRKLARLRAARGDQSAAIEAYEQALDVSADAGVIRDLADAYAKRGGDADRTQAADLYCTLGDVMGAPDGAQWLERALDQVPGHDAALDLLESFVPPEQHGERLIQRWQAYVERSDDEASVDKRRMLLARAHAARGAARDALICLGPLIERSDADALELQTECLAILRAEEQRDSAASKPPAAGKPIKPATLVGFRVPPKDPQPFESAEKPEPVSETRARPSAPASQSAQAQAAQEGKPAAAGKSAAPVVAQPVERSKPAAAKPAADSIAAKPATAPAPPKQAAPVVKEAAPAIKRKPRPQSGETLVGFHLPPELAAARPNEAEAQAELEEAAAQLAAGKTAADGAERVESSRVVLRANAPAQRVPSARASGAGQARPAITRSASTSAVPNRAPARTLMGVAPAGPAAAAAALKAAAAARNSSAPPAARASSIPPAAASAASKAAELRAAALRATVPTGVIGGDASQARASAPAAAPASISSRPPFPARTSVAPVPAAVPAAPAARAATMPAVPAAEPAQEVAAAGAAHEAQPEPAPAHSLPMRAPALVDSPFLSAATGPASSRRWWIASAVALVVLGGAVVLIARPTSKAPAPPAPSSRVESAPPQPTPEPAAAPIAVAAAAAPSAATAPSTTPVPSAAAPAPSAPHPAPAPAPARRERHANPEVKTNAKQLKIKGSGLSNKDVLGALDDAIDKIETCYGRILDKNPRAQGDITVSFSVDKSGKATHVRKVSATLKDAAAQKCATEAIGKTRFPKTKKPVSVTAPLSFKKG